MDKAQILDFIRKNPVFALATSENNVPHARYIMLYKADDRGLLFVTGENKDVHKQLQANPVVELCFSGKQENKQIRITGTVDKLNDTNLKIAVVEDFPFLKEWVDKQGYEVLVCYCLKNGKAYEWTMETNFAPKTAIQL